MTVFVFLQASLKWKETTLDTNKQNVSSQIAAMNAATAQVVTLTSGECYVSDPPLEHMPSCLRHVCPHLKQCHLCLDSNIFF
jgi:hypothetical protein